MSLQKKIFHIAILCIIAFFPALPAGGLDPPSPNDTTITSASVYRMDGASALRITGINFNSGSRLDVFLGDREESLEVICCPGKDCSQSMYSGTEVCVSLPEDLAGGSYRLQIVTGEAANQYDRFDLLYLNPHPDRTIGLAEKTDFRIEKDSQATVIELLTDSRPFDVGYEIESIRWADEVTDKKQNAASYVACNTAMQSLGPTGLCQQVKARLICKNTHKDNAVQITAKLRASYIGCGEVMNVSESLAEGIIINLPLQCQGCHNGEVRFYSRGEGTVKDNNSGLVWLRNANCFGQKTWPQAMQAALYLSDGDCGLSDGSQQGDWRLPTKDELIDFVCKDYQDPAVCNSAGTGQWQEGDPFTGVQSTWYWSSTTSASSTGLAWGVSMWSGGVDDTPKGENVYVWPVRASWCEH